MSTDLGDVYPLSYDHLANGALASATAATWTITLPDATTSSFAATTTGVGQYRNDYTTLQAGRHLARWVGTGANAGAYEVAFNVTPQGASWLISLEEAKEQLNIAATSTVHDEELRRFVLGVTDVIERQLGKVTAPRTFVEHRRLPCVTDRLALRVPLLSVTSVVSLDGTETWNVADLVIDAETGIVTVLPTATPFYGGLVITYRAGHVVMPDNVLLATRMALQEYWRTQRTAPGGPRIVGANEDERMLLGGVRILNPEAKSLLGEPLPGIA